VEKGFILIAFIYESAGSKIPRETFINMNESYCGAIHSNLYILEIKRELGFYS